MANSIVIERQKKEVSKLYLQGMSISNITQTLTDEYGEDYITSSQVRGRIESIRNDWKDARAEMGGYESDLAEHLKRLDALLHQHYKMLVDEDGYEMELQARDRLAILGSIRAVLADRAKVLSLGTVKVDLTTAGEKVGGSVLVLPHNGRNELISS